MGTRMGFSGHRKLFAKYSIFFYAQSASISYIIAMLYIYQFPDYDSAVLCGTFGWRAREQYTDLEIR